MTAATGFLGSSFEMRSLETKTSMMPEMIEPSRRNGNSFEENAQERKGEIGKTGTKPIHVEDVRLDPHEGGGIRKRLQGARTVDVVCADGKCGRERTKAGSVMVTEPALKW
jgi:hypothetical protein